ncbi:MAG: glycerophosphodiester phosphodiesterase [Clostridia bacterium]|nr:glycerophosphodiester phosphodiesterase [Clostridiales bacterium]MBQ2976471.1 glycerophosphodiester phosphodiesterase [Clostridia bacterium]
MKNYWTLSEDNIFVAAHRGFSEKYPENTIPAFQAAIDLNVDQLEIDIRVTKDDQLVIIHDATVDRTTNGTGKVCDYTLEELRRLDAGSWKGEEFKGLQIPTLIEFMDLVKDLPDMTIDFELKEYPVAGWEEKSYSVCDRVMKIIDDYGYTDRCVINTFNGKLHGYIHKKYGKKYRQHVYYPPAYMGEYDEEPYNYAYCSCMFRSVKKDYDWMKARGVQPWAGASVKNAETVDQAIADGAVLITCNNPDVILQLLRERGKHK